MKKAKKGKNSKETKRRKKTKKNDGVMGKFKELELLIGTAEFDAKLSSLETELGLTRAYRVDEDVVDDLAVRAPDGHRYHAGDPESAWFISQGRVDLALA